MPAQAGTASHFSLLDRPASEFDALPSYLAERPPYPSCDWSRARRGSSNVWLIPRRDGRYPCLMATFEHRGMSSAATVPGNGRRLSR